jgi:hypothetical protein
MKGVHQRPVVERGNVHEERSPGPGDIASTGVKMRTLIGDGITNDD